MHDDGRESGTVQERAGPETPPADAGGKGEGVSNPDERGPEGDSSSPGTRVGLAENPADLPATGEGGSVTVHKEDFQVSKTLEKLLRPLRPEEYAALKAQIAHSRHIDPLTVGVTKSGRYLLDGHNRLKIARELDLPFGIVEIPLDTIADCMQWMREHQVGRRNLTDEEYRYIVGKEYLKQKGQKGRKKGAAKAEGNDRPKDTAADVGGKRGRSRRSVQRDAAFAEEVERVRAEEGEEAAADLLSGKRKPAKKKPKRKGKGGGKGVKVGKGRVDWKALHRIMGKTIALLVDDLKDGCGELVELPPFLDLSMHLRESAAALERLQTVYQSKESAK